MKYMLQEQKEEPSEKKVENLLSAKKVTKIEGLIMS